jgi:hypothetical protein
MTSAYVLVPSLILLIIAIVIAIIAIDIIILYRDIGEPIFIHVAIISIFLFLTCLSGSIGLYLNLDQSKHPIFMFNTFTISMTYVGTGLIYRNLKQDNSVGLDYLIILLLLAPAYSLALILGLKFAIIPAITSQFTPLLICFVLETKIYKRVNSLEISTGKNEDILVNSLKYTFQGIRIAHFIGMLGMIGFTTLAVLGQDLNAEIMWGENWQVYDYFYFVALVSLMVVSLIVLFILRKVRKPIRDADISLIINSLIQ